MLNDPRISVILPVYNIGAYLDACMETLLGQTFPHFEAILLNDGSTDDSLARCLAWAEKDGRVRVVDKGNEGVAPTRNLGVRLARGEYIAFVDPDDWLDPEYLEKLYSAAEDCGADMVECDLWRCDDRTGAKIYRSCYGRMGVPYTLPEHMKYGPTATYKALFRRDLWTRYAIRQPSCSFESPAIYSLLLALSRRVVNVREALYYYRRFRENSLVETGYAGPDGGQNNTLAIDAMGFLIDEFRRTGQYAHWEAELEGVIKYRLSDILAMQYHRKPEGDFAELVRNYRAFLGSQYPGRDPVYVTFGGYNLDRVCTHMDILHDPACRFNFSSVAVAASPEAAGVEIRHKNRYRRMMLEKEWRGSLQAVLRTAEPQFFVMNCIEERFDLMETAYGVVTCSDAWEGSNLPEAVPGRRIPRDSQECEALWRKGVERLLALCRREAPGIRFVVVEDYLSTEVGDIASREPFPGQEEIRRTNEILRRYYAFLRERIPDAVWVYPAEDPLYFTDRAYEYGAVPSHLNEIVNQRTAAKLEAAIRAEMERL